MSDNRDPTRRYGEQEVGLILKRATELQRHAPEATEGGGLTLAELQEIAGEAGIDPRFLEAAAGELDRVGPTPEGVEKWLGGPVVVVLERRIEAEVSPDDFDRVIETIGRASNGQGQPGVIGRTLTWTLSDPNSQRYLQITVTSREGETRIRMEERMRQLAGAYFGGIMAGGGLSLGLGVGIGVGVPMGLPIFATIFPFAAIGGSYVLARHFFGRTARKRRKALIRLMDQLTELVREVGVPTARLPEGAAGQAALPRPEDGGAGRDPV